jgi:beta propeller domain-containing protein
MHAPQLGGSRAVADMVVVSAFDLRDPRLVDSLAIVGRTEALYVSPSNLYLASGRYETAGRSGARLPAQASLYNTDIHQIGIDAGGMRVVGSGSIEGLVGWGDKAAFRFGEHKGKLGVVSSINTGWWGNNSNRVTILQPSSIAQGMLKTVSYLPNSRRQQPLGKPNEMVYGTRFVGDKLYAVTFRQVDPLYIVDLADGSDPKITGELEIPGFSDYLHPLPNGLLLGFGRDATVAGLFQGLHLTLFDVTGAAPRQIQRVGLGKRGSDSAIFGSHHAFSALARPDGSTLVAFPASINDGTPMWGGTGDSAYYPWQYSGLMSFEIRGATAADAHLVQKQTLVSARAADGLYSNPPNGEGTTWGAGRSVLFPEASIYVGGGKFWRQDSTGATFGPY